MRLNGPIAIMTTFFIASFLCITVDINLAFAQSAVKVKSEEELMRENMLSISKQLGVTCNSCHISENFRSDKKMEFKIAKEHMKITQLLIDSGMDGKLGPKATCYMCHRGEAKPKYQEPKDPLR